MKLFLEVVDRAWPASAPRPALPSVNDPDCTALLESVRLASAALLAPLPPPLLALLFWAKARAKSAVALKTVLETMVKKRASRPSKVLLTQDGTKTRVGQRTKDT